MQQEPKESMGVSWNKGRDRVTVGFGGRLEFRRNWNEAVLIGSRQTWTCRKGLASSLRWEVDSWSCILGYHKVKINMDCCVQNPLIRSSASGLVIQIWLWPTGQECNFSSHWHDLKQQSFSALCLWCSLTKEGLIESHLTGITWCLNHLGVSPL